MSDLAALLHPWTCVEDIDHPGAEGGWACNRAAADLDYRGVRVAPDLAAAIREHFDVHHLGINDKCVEEIVALSGESGEPTTHSDADEFCRCADCLSTMAEDPTDG